MTKIMKIKIINEEPYDYEEQIKNNPEYNKWSDPIYIKKYFRDYNRKKADVIEPFIKLTEEEKLIKKQETNKIYSKKKIHCIECNADIHIVNKKRHNNSRTHLDNVKIFDYETYNLNNPIIEPIIEDDKYYCKDCKCIVLKRNILKHNRTIKHLNIINNTNINIDNNNIIEKPLKEGQYKCQDCNKVLFKKNSSVHNKTLNHLKYVKKDDIIDDKLTIINND